MDEMISELFILPPHAMMLQEIRTHGATGQSFTDIFESRLDKKSKWSTPVPVDNLNSEFEDGTPSFSSDYKEIYFTRCEAGKREKKGCVIMYSKRSGDTWSDPAIQRYFPIHLWLLIRHYHPMDSHSILFQICLADLAKRIFMSATRDDENDPWSKPRKSWTGY